jgi:hypothetical protein
VLHQTDESVYGYTAPDDGRSEEFAAWIARSEVAAAAAVNFTSTPGNKQITISPISVTSRDTNAA